MIVLQMAIQLEHMLRTKVNVVFPTKSVRVSNQDKPYITAELKKFDKYVKKEYKSRGKSEKYVKLKLIYDTKFDITQIM